MARRKRWNEADTPDKRCVYCLARYRDLRAGMSQDDAAMIIAASLESGGGYGRFAGTTRGALHSEDDAAELCRDKAMAMSSAHKRQVWSGLHGPGRCIPPLLEPIGPITRDEQDWQLRELIADLILDDEDVTYQADDGVDVDVSFDPDDLDDGVPVYIDDGQATCCVAA